MSDKELILLKMKILYESSKVFDLVELAIGLDFIAKDAWDKIAEKYPPSIRIDA